MQQRHSFNHRSHLLGLFRLLLVSLALVSQLALGAMVVPDAPPRSNAAILAALSVLCNGHPADPHAPIRRHRVPDPAVCPASVALALPSVAPTSPVVFPLPVSTAVLPVHIRPAARAPPPVALHIRSPRGPPILA